MRKLMNRAPALLIGAAFALALALALALTFALSAPSPATASDGVIVKGKDSDGDGLININSTNQMYAMRWDLDGNGKPDDSAAPTANTYKALFDVANMGCAPTTTEATAAKPLCVGYELDNNIPLDPNPTIAPEHNWDTIIGWNANFNGNGYVITNMKTRGSGFFKSVATGKYVKKVGLQDAEVTRGDERGNVGLLAGVNNGEIASSYATGAIAYTNAAHAAGARHVTIGGLVGDNRRGGTVKTSWSDVAIDITGSGARVGGFAGVNRGRIVGSYAYGAIAISGLPAEPPRFCKAAGFVASNMRLARATIEASFTEVEISDPSGLCGTYSFSD